MILMVMVLSERILSRHANSAVCHGVAFLSCIFWISMVMMLSRYSGVDCIVDTVLVASIRALVDDREGWCRWGWCWGFVCALAVSGEVEFPCYEGELLIKYHGIWRS